MRSLKRAMAGDYSLRREAEDVPVPPCTGWEDDCDLCSKRFSSWVEGVESTLSQIPQTPGILQTALRNRGGGTEVVYISHSNINLQRFAQRTVDRVKEKIADRSCHASKLTIHCRWWSVKDLEDRDCSLLFAHWCNYGILPRFHNSWPGLGLLQKCGHLVKPQLMWCHPKMAPVWRRPRTQPTKSVELVQGCDWSKPCEVCDKRFGDWFPIASVTKTIEAEGIFMVSAVSGSTREVVAILFDHRLIEMNKMTALSSLALVQSQISNQPMFSNRATSLEVRWIHTKDGATSDESDCTLYAHWLNCGTYPILNLEMPGEKALEKNNAFVFRLSDKKWCREIYAYQQRKFNKAKCKRIILSDLEDDYFFYE